MYIVVSLRLLRLLSRALRICPQCRPRVNPATVPGRSSSGLITIEALQHAVNEAVRSATESAVRRQRPAVLFASPDESEIAVYNSAYMEVLLSDVAVIGRNMPGDAPVRFDWSATAARATRVLRGEDAVVVSRAIASRLVAGDLNGTLSSLYAGDNDDMMPVLSSVSSVTPTDPSAAGPSSSVVVSAPFSAATVSSPVPTKPQSLSVLADHAVRQPELSRTSQVSVVVLSAPSSVTESIRASVSTPVISTPSIPAVMAAPRLPPLGRRDSSVSVASIARQDPPAIAAAAPVRGSESDVALSESSSAQSLSLPASVVASPTIPASSAPGRASSSQSSRPALAPVVAPGKRMPMSVVDLTKSQSDPAVSTLSVREPPSVAKTPASKSTRRSRTEKRGKHDSPPAKKSTTEASSKSDDDSSPEVSSLSSSSSSAEEFVPSKKEKIKKSSVKLRQQVRSGSRSACRLQWCSPATVAWCEGGGESRCRVNVY